MTEHLLTADSSVQRCDDVIQAEIDGELVMMNLINGDYYGLDKIASRVWEIIEHPKTVAEIIGQLLLEFNVQPEHCKKDIHTLLTHFHKHNIIIITA